MADFARSDHPAVQAQLDRLAMLSPAGDRLGLERIEQLLDRLGRPQDRLPPVFHVAGTNGKGSVCAFLRAALEASGRSVHMFTSPHLVRFNERMRVAGRLIEDQALAALLTETIDAGHGIEPSFFEVATAAAFLAFASTPADACILEVGLGGRLDATNVIVDPLVCGIAALGHDHQQFLGSDLIGIAREKAGIAKPGVPLVFADYPDEVAAAVADVAEAAGALPYPAFRRWHFGVARGRIQYRDAGGALMVPMPTLCGPHQTENCALAIAMLRHQQMIDVPLAALNRMPVEARWPARMQQLHDGSLAALLPAGSELWVDGGHNPSAAAMIAEHLRDAFDDRLPLVILFASLSTKDPQRMLEPFEGLASEVKTLPIASHDCRDPAELAALAGSLGFDAEPYASMPDALANLRRPARVLVFGSLYLAGEALAANGEAPD